MIRCQHCGHEVPEGSVFCNHCGYRMSNEVTCSYCHEPMPSTSVFCPHCGKAVDNAMNVASRQTTKGQGAPRPMTYNEQRQAAQRQAQQRQANAWKQPEVEPEEDDDDNDGGGSRSHYDRNLIIGIVSAMLTSYHLVLYMVWLNFV